MAKKIMAWSKCSVKIGTASGTGTMPTSMTSVGTVKYQSAVLEASDGDALSARATGGVEVAHEDLEGGLVFTARVIEPEAALYTALGLGEASGDAFDVDTHIPAGNFALRVEPKNVGAMGIDAPLTSVKFKPGWSEEEGNYADLTFSLLKVDDNTPWYKRVPKAAPAGG
jgi:hypothetical protein